uniref:Transmembrane p24 trafficking protein 3 n=1 Tax=Lynx canadensis TaxID=61383 RepID=A0A667GJ13_LYNCA
MGPAGARPGSPPSPPLLLLLLLLLLLRAERPRGAELTFELPDSAKQCFHEDVERGAKFSLDYQVITGGHYDVDCYVEDPLGKTIYRETKKQYDSFTHRAEVKGVYQFCFSNEFSTFSHKTVYFDFQVGDEPPILPDMGNRVTALTQMESACVTIHEALKTVIDSQTHYRLREAQDRARAEELSSRVSYWSVGETVALFLEAASSCGPDRGAENREKTGSGCATCHFSSHGVCLKPKSDRVILGHHLPVAPQVPRVTAESSLWAGRSRIIGIPAALLPSLTPPRSPCCSCHTLGLASAPGPLHMPFPIRTPSL